MQETGPVVPAQNGGAKGSEPSEAEAPALRLRLLVPHALVPALIGKKGENVKRIRRESGAAVSVADPVLGCDERVVHITGESLDAEESTAAADALVGVFNSICYLQQGGAAARRGEATAAAAAAAAAQEPAAAPAAAAAQEPAAAPAAAAQAPAEDAAAAPADAGTEQAAGGGCAGEPAGEAAASPASGAWSLEEDAGSGSSSASAAGDTAAGGSAPASQAGSTAGQAAVAAGKVAAAAAGAAAGAEARMLVDSSLVGYLVGKGGCTIKETIAKSGASVRILPKPELPACACIGDELVRVTGSAEAVAAALRLLAVQIKAHPLGLGAMSHDGSGSGGGSSYGAGPQLVGGLQPPPLMLAQASHPDLAFMHPALGGSLFAMGGAAGLGTSGLMAAYSGSAVEVMFRLLAPVMRTGNIIGKGGEHIRRVRSETGARIKIFDPAPGSEERVVALTSSEDALSPYCAAQDALIRCVIALTADDTPNAPHRVRLLTAQASVGIVLGKRGATVSQLRHETGASIKVLPADAMPAAYGGGLGSDDSEAEMGSISSSGGGGGLSSSIGGTGSGSASSSTAEEIIQVEGSVQQCAAALRGVATLLRGWQIRRHMMQQQQQFGGMAAAAALMQQQQAAAMQQAGPLSPGAAGIPGGGGMPPSPRSPGGGMMGIHLPNSLQLGSPVQPTYVVVNGGGGMGNGSGMLPPGMLPTPMLQQRYVSYVYHLTNAQVGAVLGKGGAHIAQIRNASGARVQLQTELEDGGRVLLVQGLQEQCHAAHSMANAFLSMGHCEPAYPEPMMG